MKIPEISKITISISDTEKIKGSNVKAGAVKNVKPAKVETPQELQENKTFVSFVKEKINHKLSKLKKSFEERIFSDKKSRFIETDEDSKEKVSKKFEQNIKILEND